MGQYAAKYNKYWNLLQLTERSVSFPVVTHLRNQLFWYVILNTVQTDQTTDETQETFCRN